METKKVDGAIAGVVAARDEGWTPREERPFEGATSRRCDRCRAAGIDQPGKVQPSDGDAAMLFIAAHGETAGDDVLLCRSCVGTLEAMSLRAGGNYRRGAEARRNPKAGG